MHDRIATRALIARLSFVEVFLLSRILLVCPQLVKLLLRVQVASWIQEELIDWLVLALLSHISLAQGL